MNNILSKSFFRWVEGASLVFFIFALCYGWWFFRIRPPQVRAATNVLSVDERDAKPVVARQPMSSDDFNRIISRRDIFSRKVSAVAPKETVVVDGGKLPPQFRVAGFLLGGDPQIVIEDTVSRQTLFVGRTQGPSGMKIERVDAEKVYLSYQNKNYSINIKD